MKAISYVKLLLASFTLDRQLSGERRLEHLRYGAMRKFPFDPDNAYSYWMIFPFACALAVVGAKCWVISVYASPTPFWDQWDAEAAGVYQPYFAGTLRLSDLIVPHNEHRILITRLWSLLLLELNGYWDPILQMVANALLSGLAIALLIATFRPMLDIVSLIVFSLFSMVIFALPLAWENLLSGFHSQWYFLILASVTGLILLHGAAAFTARWWLATLLFCVSYFCMAGGALTLAAATALCVVQFAVGRRSGAKELLALAMLAALCAWVMLDIPAISAHRPLRAQSIGQFFSAMTQIGGWPLGRSTPMSLLLAPIIHAPAILLSIYVALQRPALVDRRWLVVALTGWTILNAAATAYGRGQFPMAPRYLDVYSISLVLNCACLLYFVDIASDSPPRRKLVFSATAVWLLLVLSGAVDESVRHSAVAMADRQAVGRIQTENLQAYLMTNDINFLANKPRLHIPYPDAERLAAIASSPTIRAILPPALVGESSAAAARQRGVARFTGRAAEAFKRFMLRHGFLLMPIGLAFLLVGILFHGTRSNRKIALSACVPVPKK